MKKKSGFTLIEMLVVVAIVGIILPAIFAIIFAVVRQQARVFALKQVKREGDYLLNTMEFGIRNYAAGIFDSSNLNNEYCDQALTPGRTPYPSTGGNDGSRFVFDDDLGNWFRYYLTGTYVASQSATLNTRLTTPRVQITNFALSCDRAAAYASPIVSISFDISYSGSQFQEETVTLHYQTQIQMKNY